LIGASVALPCDFAAIDRLPIVARHLAFAGRQNVVPAATRKIRRHG
jgi:hypothetical protein